MHIKGIRYKLENMYSIAKNLISNTPINPLAKKLSRYIRESKLPRIKRLNRQYNRQTVEIMRRVLTQESSCIDVGAHRGSILSVMLNIAPNGIHYAFEPIPGMAENLRVNFPQAKVYDIALCDVKRTATFYHRISMPGVSSLSTNERYSGNTIEVSVKTDKLDNIIKGKVDLIKIDVEGAQLQVMIGGLTTIQKNKPYIIFEHGRDRVDISDQIYKLLVDQCSLKISLLGDWLRDKKPLTQEKFREQVEVNRYRKQEMNWYFLAHP